MSTYWEEPKSIAMAAPESHTRQQIYDELIPNGPKPGNWFCNTCQTYFDVPYEQTQGGRS